MPIHGVWINNLFMNPPHTTYLAKVFERAGYGTGYSGKWHLDGGGDPATGEFTLQFRPRTESYVWPSRRRGFQDWLGYECCTDHDAPFFWDDSIDPPVYTPVPEFGWEPRFQRAALRDFVERQKNANHSWMYEVAIGPPHTPNEAPPEFMALYDPDTIPLPGWIPEGLTPDQEIVARQTLQVVYAMVTFVDYEIGNMLADLDELGQSENTIVVFTADNGDLLGSHWDLLGYLPLNFRYKDLPFQNAFRVPLIMRWPRSIPAGREVDALISEIDLPPTILSLADLPVPWRMQGDDMSEWARGGQGPVHPGVWVHLERLFLPSWFAVWTGDYLYSEGDIRHLYDVQADPNETSNLFDQPELAGVQAELSSLVSSLTAEALSPSTLPDACGERERVEAQLDDALSLFGQAALVDGVSVRAYIGLMLAVACGEGNNAPVRTALLNAFGRNMDAFDRTDFIEGRRFRALVTLAMSGSDALAGHIRTTLQNRWNITLRAAYEHVACEEGGACTPEDPFPPNIRSDGTPRATIEPLSGAGDVDGDGLSNAVEFQNARTAGTGVDGFILAALDPARDGTEPGPSGEGRGACFIATAAYGTPLASELDRFRALRDNTLLPGAAGAAFTDAYYRLSPSAATWLAARPFAKASVRTVLALSLDPYSCTAGLVYLAFVVGAFKERRRGRANSARKRRAFPVTTGPMARSNNSGGASSAGRGGRQTTPHRR